MENEMKELNIIKFNESGFEYVVTLYADETEIKYYETNGEDEMILRNSLSLPAHGYDIQILRKIVQLREMIDKEN